MGLAIDDGLELEIAVEQCLHLLRRLRVEGVAEHVDEPLFADCNLVLKLEGEGLAGGSINPNALVHRAEDWPEEGLLEVMDRPEVHRVDGGLLGGVDFKGDNRVFAVVFPELVFAGLRVPFLALVFPVGVVLAVHGREEVQALGEVGEEHVLGQHRVAVEVGKEVQPPPEVLRVVEEVLADDLAVGMGEDLVEGEADRGFLFRGPVAFGTFDTHQGDAEGFGIRPRQAYAGGVPCASFDVNTKAAGAGLDLELELMEDLDYCVVIRAGYERIIRADYLPELRFVRSPAHVMHDDLTQRPLPHHSGGMVSRDDFRGVVEGKREVTFHDTSTPRSNPPLPGQCPQPDVAKSDDDVRPAHFDFTLEEVKALDDFLGHELVTDHNVLTCDVGFPHGDEVADVIGVRTDTADIRDEAVRPHDPGFLQHLGKLLPGVADKRLPAIDFLFAGSFPD